MAELTAERVTEIVKDCLFRDDEIHDGKPPDDAVIVEGIVRNFGFHPQRLESHRAEIAEMLQELPDQFHEGRGGGWSFLNMCMTKDDVQWGEHTNMEELIALASGLGLAKYAMPREMWRLMPGGVPYIIILKPASEGQNVPAASR